MYILKKSPRTLGIDEPIKHESHKAPVSRRDFIAQGFRTGPAIVAGGARAQRAHGTPGARCDEPAARGLRRGHLQHLSQARARFRSFASISPAARTCRVPRS